MKNRQVTPNQALNVDLIINEPTMGNTDSVSNKIGFVGLAKNIAKIGLLAAALATTGCGGDKPTDAKKTSPNKAPAVSKPAPKKAEEPEPVVTETPTAMDDYVKQRRAERQARGPVDYPSPVPVKVESEDGVDGEEIPVVSEEGSEGEGLETVEGADADMDSGAQIEASDEDVVDDDSLDDTETAPDEEADG